MSDLRYTLLSDGASDRCLVWIINFSLAAVSEITIRGIIPQIADLRQLQNPSKFLDQRMDQALRQYPCDILFVHRDAESAKHESRVLEIREAAKSIPLPHVPVVPVRMTEAWLLLEELAIRRAADNPNGTVPLNLPGIPALEGLVDPKKLLFELLERAAEKTGRRKEQFKRDLPMRRQRVAELIRDFSPLRQLSAFQAFESDLRIAVGVWVAAG